MRGKTTFHIRWKLFFYDVIVFAVTSVFLLVLYEGPVKLTQRGELQQMLLASAFSSVLVISEVTVLYFASG